MARDRKELQNIKILDGTQKWSNFLVEVKHIRWGQDVPKYSKIAFLGSLANIMCSVILLDF